VTPTSDLSGRDPVEVLAEEFFDRQRRGEQPTIDEYAERWPDVDLRPVPDVNHYTIVLSRRGADAVARAVHDLG